MRRMTRLLTTTALGAVLLAGLSCRSGGADPAEGEATSSLAWLRVTNDNFNDVDIYVVRSGLPTRIGRVSAGRTQQFTLTPALLGPSDVSFIASISGGNARASSGSLVVSAGQTVDFRVSSALAQSTATVR